ncbi:hypothetical protein [Klebsiella pneumoniae]|uniref:hypothetical protein n=1 Tax=Klebsiella pneumoniae TaxID=573 RepID=UPI00388F9B08
MTSKLTRERIELIANFHRAMALPPSHAEIEELARMALAAMDSEPVIIVGDDGGDALSYRRLIQSFEPGTKLYRHAQPAPVVPAVSDDIGEIRVGRLPTMNQDDYPAWVIGGFNFALARILTKYWRVCMVLRHRRRTTGPKH